MRHKKILYILALLFLFTQAIVPELVYPHETEKPEGRPLYGWWSSREPDLPSLGAKGKAKKDMSHQGGTVHPGRQEPKKESLDKKALGKGFSGRNNSGEGNADKTIPDKGVQNRGTEGREAPNGNLFLHISGGKAPESPPIVYYRVSERGSGESGRTGMRLAKVTFKNGVWQAELGKDVMGAIELFSSFQLSGKTFYSQYNYTMFRGRNTPVERGAGIQQKNAEHEAEIELPTEWPVFSFPAQRRGMLFTSAQPGAKVAFAIQNAEHLGSVQSISLYSSRQKPEVVGLGHDGLRFSFAPDDDDLLYAGGRPSSKEAVLVAELAGGQTGMAFSFAISGSPFGKRSIGLGLGVLGASSVLMVGLVLLRRRRFKYRAFN